MFTGIYAPIATPFAGDKIAYDKLQANLEKYNKSRLAGVVVLGSNGEFALLSHQEKVELVGFVRKHLAADKKVIAGTGCESTMETIQLTQEAAAAGADCALIVTPWYYKGNMTDAVLEAHFTEVADTSPIPVMLYNMPRNAGVNMSAGLVAKLAKHPNIVGVKDSSGDIVQIASIINNTPKDFSVFAGSGSFLYATVALGGVGGTLAVANILPDMCVDIYEAAAAGRHEEAKELQMKILAANAAVTTRWGIAGLKAALDMLGYYGGQTRKPLQPMAESQLPELRKVLTEVGAL